MARTSSDEKRRRILQAAEELLADRRMHEVKLDEVAERAAVGKGTIYLYFKDKDDLVLHVATAGLDELCERIQPVMAAASDFETGLRAVCAEVSAFFRERKAVMQGEGAGLPLCTPELKRQWLARRRRLVMAMAEILVLGQDQRRVREDVPAEILADFLLGMLRTRARDLAAAPKIYREDQFIVELFLQGAAARTSAAPVETTK
jgi:AcrR family transcriptional regulator